MKRAWRDIALVTRYELSDSLRSRRVAVLLVLYVGVGLLSINLFIHVLHKLENQLSDALQLPASASAGAVTSSLWKSERFRRMLVSLVGNEEVALDLLGFPPVALMQGWLALTFTPFLTVLGAAGRIAEEVGAGSARMALFRTSRGAWCLGKFLGQTALVLVALLLNAAAAWTVARFRVAGLDAGAAASGMLLFAGRAWLYALPFLGLALGVSQCTRSAHLATALAFAGLVVQAALYGVAKWAPGRGFAAAWETLALLLPQGHHLALWRMDAPHLAQAAAYLVGLALAYLFAAHAFFRRRDL
jgi:ABC-type transport system involved in multi-copper enzyme maturation permease subunit